jgi:hypothetical protein
LGGSRERWDTASLSVFGILEQRDREFKIPASILERDAEAVDQVKKIAVPVWHLAPARRTRGRAEGLRQTDGYAGVANRITR